MSSNTFHLALAKFFSICAQTPSLMFLSEAAFPEILKEGAEGTATFFQHVMIFVVPTVYNKVDHLSFVGVTIHV